MGKWLGPTVSLRIWLPWLVLVNRHLNRGQSDQAMDTFSHKEGAMKRRGTLSALFGALILCLAGGPSALADSGGKVTGGGMYFNNTHPVILSVNAIQQKDGTVNGHFEQHNPDNNNLFVHGTVSCLDFVNDTTVLVSGFLTDVHNVPPGFEYIQPGAAFLLFIQDNGNGSGGPADRVSFYFVNDVPFPCGDAEFIAGTAQLFQELPEFTHLLTAGNVQVSR
jgi:hypothetical protein